MVDFLRSRFQRLFELEQERSEVYREWDGLFRTCVASDLDFSRLSSVALDRFRESVSEISKSIRDLQAEVRGHKDLEDNDLRASAAAFDTAVDEIQAAEQLLFESVIKYQQASIQYARSHCRAGVSDPHAKQDQQKCSCSEKSKHDLDEWNEDEFRDIEVRFRQDRAQAVSQITEALDSLRCEFTDVLSSD